MIDLHGIVAPIVGVINDPIVGTLTACSGGYTTGADGTQVSNYAAPVSITLDVQAITNEDIKHIDGLNIQGIVRSVWADGDLHAIDRTQGFGGDLLAFSGASWLVVKVIESWNGVWCHVVVQRQKS